MAGYSPMQMIKYIYIYIYIYICVCVCVCVFTVIDGWHSLPTREWLFVELEQFNVNQRRCQDRPSRRYRQSTWNLFAEPRGRIVVSMDSLADRSPVLRASIVRLHVHRNVSLLTYRPRSLTRVTWLREATNDPWRSRSVIVVDRSDPSIHRSRMRRYLYVCDNGFLGFDRIARKNKTTATITREPELITFYVDEWRPPPTPYIRGSAW